MSRQIWLCLGKWYKNLKKNHQHFTWMRAFITKNLNTCSAARITTNLYCAQECVMRNGVCERVREKGEKLLCAAPLDACGVEGVFHLHVSLDGVERRQRRRRLHADRGARARVWFSFAVVGGVFAGQMHSPRAPPTPPPPPARKSRMHGVPF